MADELQILDALLKVATWRRTRVLDVHGRRVLSSGASAKRVVDAVRECGGVERFDASGTRVSDEALAVLLAGHVGCGTLQHLNLGQTPLADDGVRHLANWLTSSDAAALHTLMLDHVLRVSSAAVVALATAVSHCASLRLLSLEGVALDDHASAALAAALERNYALRSLNLASCALTPTSLAPLCAALSGGRNATLHQLVLSGNRLGRAGVELLMAMCVANDSLRLLRLCRAELDDAALDVVVGQLAHCDAVRELALELNCYSLAAATRLVEHVAAGSARSLTALTLDHARALDDTLAPALQRNADRQPPLGAPLVELP